MIKLVIFDWDDVFTLNAKDGYIKCLHDTIVDLGVHLDPEEEHRRILSKWSQPHREELRALLQEQPELLDQACDLYEEKFFGDTFVGALEFVDGANELLLRLKENYTMAIATGAHPVILRERVMPKFNVPDVFSQIFSAYEIDDPEKCKPHPYMLEEILRVHGCKPEEAVFVGDAKTDVQMGFDADVTPIVVLSGHLNREQAEELGVKYIVDDVTKIEPILEELSN